MKADINIPMYAGEMMYAVGGKPTTIDSTLFFKICRQIIKNDKCEYNINDDDLIASISNIDRSKGKIVNENMIIEQSKEIDLIEHSNIDVLMSRISMNSAVVQKREEELLSLCRWIVPCIPEIGMMNVSINIIVSISNGNGMSFSSNALYLALRGISNNTKNYIKHIDVNVDSEDSQMSITDGSIIIFDDDIKTAAQFNNGSYSIIMFTSPDRVSDARTLLSKTATTFVINMEDLDAHDICELLSQEFYIDKEADVVYDTDTLLKTGYSPRDIISSFKLSSMTEPFKQHSNTKKKILSYNKTTAFAITSRISQLEVFPNKSIASIVTYIKERVHGQDAAISKLTSALAVAKFGLNRKGKPVIVSLLMGPTGTGKTELAKALSVAMYGTNNIIHLNMGEFSEKHYIARLLGAPPGYVGHGKDPQFVRDINNKSGNTIILFDEIEKAAPEILQALLQIMDEGIMTTANGKRIDMTRSIIILTSNALSYKLGKKLKIGIGLDDENKHYGDNDIKELLIKEKVFSPEFINRLDSISNFEYLDVSTVTSIAKMHLDILVRDLKVSNVKLTYTKKLLKEIYEVYDKDFGGRSILRTIDKIKENAVENILKGNKKIKARLV